MAEVCDVAGSGYFNWKKRAEIKRRSHKSLCFEEVEATEWRIESMKSLKMDSIGMVLKQCPEMDEEGKKQSKNRKLCGGGEKRCVNIYFTKAESVFTEA